MTDPGPLPDGERLQKYLARCGVGSRRHCEALITAGKVTVNGQVATVLGSRVQPHDDVRAGGKRAVPRRPVYYLINKPAGCLTSCDNRQGKTVIDVAQRRGVKERVFPVGRLDLDTEGLLILTNDGHLANYLMHPRHHVGKTYRVDTAAPVTEAECAQLRAGVQLEDAVTSPAEVTVSPAEPCRTFVTIYEGRNRQVRRMFAALGHEILYLQRVAYGHLRLGDLPKGDVRPISRALLLRLIGVPDSGESAIAEVSDHDGTAEDDSEA